MDLPPTPAFRPFPLFLRALAFAAIMLGVAAADVVIWRGVAAAWAKGFHFHASDVFNAAAMRDAVTLFVLVIAVYLFPQNAGLGRPDVRKAGWTLPAYAILIAAAASLFFTNSVHPFFSAPFANRGPLFFTVGPASWELLWSGYVFYVARAILKAEEKNWVSYALTGVLAVAGTAWYTPLLLTLRPMDAAGFAAVSLAIAVLSLECRRRTGSIWLGLGGHVLVKFFLAG